MSGATSFISVPIVDISGLRSPDRTERRRVAAEIGAAAREIGFLYVVGSGVDDALFDRLLAAAKEFFALPIDEKMRSYIGLSRCHRGYVPVGEEGVESGTADLKEAFDTALDLPADDPDCLLRLVHYPNDPDARDGVGIGAHTDYECFTLLKPTAPGLEVLNGAGQWIDVPPVAGAFVVNSGDMLELWTNGAFVATSHRVRKVVEERYSFPLFFNVDYHTEVKPLAQFSSRDENRRPTLRAGEHLFAQTAQTFAYLRKRMDSGEFMLPVGSLETGQFGQQARQANN